MKSIHQLRIKQQYYRIRKLKIYVNYNLCVQFSSSFTCLQFSSSFTIPCE